ncbi:MAG: hypothetical protein R2718_04335 [Solirubrobacterales bacterium]
MVDPPEPAERLILDFEGASCAVAALSSHWVGVELSHLGGSQTFLTLAGRLARSWSFGSAPRRSQALTIGEASLRIAESALDRAILECYRDSRLGLEWRLVAIELRIGVLVEVEEIPSSRDR